VPPPTSSSGPQTTGTPLFIFTETNGVVESITSGQVLFSYNGLTNSAAPPANQDSVTALPPGSQVVSADNALSANSAASANHANAEFPHVTITAAGG